MNAVVPFLAIDDLSIAAQGAAGRRVITEPASFTIGRGQTLAIVGESGSGKSLTAKAIARLLPNGVASTGSVKLEGVELTTLAESELQRIRGHRISLMLQDPFTMLNPLMKCGEHIDEMLRSRREYSGRGARRAEIMRRLAEVGIADPSVAERLPFQLSGGMCQRVALAAALARDPDLLIADEPSTALDVTTQAEIIKLLLQAQAQRGMSLILITHNLRLAFSTCQRICVLYAGSIVEIGDTAEVEASPFHPYTLGLLLSDPPADRRVKKLVTIRGTVPPAYSVSTSCGFAGRCDWAQEACRTAKPRLVERVLGRFTACIRQQEIGREMVALRAAAEQAPFEPVTAAAGEALLRVETLIKNFGARRASVRAVKAVSFHIAPGESLGLVGESGAGKTTIGRCIMGLETPTEGRIEIGGIDVSNYDRLDAADRIAARRLVQMVFQNPYSSLNPKHSVRTILEEPLRLAGEKAPASRIATLLEEVGLPADFANRRPASLSGGERQRVAIARALAVEPQLLVCDEPVSALDVSVQAQMLNVLKSLQQSRKLAFLFITHDLAVVRQIADRVIVLFQGEIVEQGAVGEVLDNPQHPYTRRLLSSKLPSAQRGSYPNLS
ncbi:MAG: ABC transporter ATP-binding protein [Cucumibacter sp.]